MQNDFPADPRSDSQLDASSISMRRALAISDGDKCPDVHAALMRASKAPSPALFGLVVTVISDAEMAEYDAQAEAFVEFAPPRMTLSESAMRRLEAGHPRTRFTIFHELSHLWLNHRGKPRFRMAMKAVRIEVIAAHSSGERQADVHAALGLMPTELVRGYRDAESIARDFGVSKAAAEVRLSQIEERSAKPTLPEVAAFLAGNGPRNETAGNDRKRRAEASVQRVWEKAAEAPGYDPSRYRLCSKGYLIAREQHLKHRSIHGWCERDGLIKSYRDINRLGIGETAFHDFADAPCAHCGNFTLSREGGALRCATCSRTAS